MTQKFHKGDLVHVAADLGRSMSHFTADIDAIVIGSYKDQYGGDSTDSYTLHLKGRGQCSWYYEGQLDLIERNRMDLLEQWEREKREEEARVSDLAWIFSHGAEVMKRPHGATLEALGRLMGMHNMWGTMGEGITLYEMQLYVMDIARPYLWTCDEEGFVDLAAEIKAGYRWPYGVDWRDAGRPMRGTLELDALVTS